MFMNINFNNIIKQILPFLILALLAYGINAILYFMLPKAKSDVVTSSIKNLEYKKYTVSNSFKDKVEKEKKVKKEPKKKEYQLISSIVLKGIYADGDGEGWIIISEKKSSTTHILSTKEKFKEFTLKSVFTKYAIFTKNGKEYKLSLDGADEKEKFTVKKAKKKEEKVKLIKEDIEQNDDSYSLKRDLVSKYIKSPTKIWNDIQIKEILNDGKIDGFRVNGLSNKSVFKKLGLKKGDIIKKVNNIELKSYADAFSIYKKIDKIKNLNMVIIRDNQEMEIDYEIK